MEFVIINSEITRDKEQKCAYEKVLKNKTMN